MASTRIVDKIILCIKFVKIFGKSRAFMIFEFANMKLSYSGLFLFPLYVSVIGKFWEFPLKMLYCIRIIYHYFS